MKVIRTSTPTLSSGGVNYHSVPWLGSVGYTAARVVPNDWIFMQALLWMHERNQRVIMIHEADRHFL